MSCAGKDELIRDFHRKSSDILCSRACVVESGCRTLVIGRDMANGLLGAGIFDEAVGGSTVWTEPLPRSWDIQGNEIIVPECLDVFDGCFLGKLC